MKVRLRETAKPGQVFEYPGNPRPNFRVITLDSGAKVMHLGRIRAQEAKDGDPNPPEHLAEHTIEMVNDDGTVAFSITRPDMPWHQEWTWPFNRLSIKRTPPDLVAANQSFAIGPIPGLVNPKPPTWVYKGPGDAAGMTLYMPTTGLRDEIGWLTELAAYWMNGGSPASMQAWAYAADSWPISLEDELTGMVPELFLELFNMYDLPGYMAGRYIFKGPRASNGYPTFGGGFTAQLAHFTDMLYHACLADMDGGLLRKLQHHATFCLVTDTSHANAGGPVISSELRGTAWGIDMLVKCFSATKWFEDHGGLPVGCRPSTYWARLVEHQADYYETQMSGPLSTTFGMCPPAERDGPWQRDYFTGMNAFAVLNGFKRFIPFLLRNLANVVARNSGKSGMPPGWGTGYYYDYVDYDLKPFANFKAVWDGFYNREQDMVAEAAAHGQVYNPAITTAQYNKLKGDPLNGGIAMNGGEYNPEARAAMVMAKTLEAKGLMPAGTLAGAFGLDFDLALSNMERMVRSHGYVYNRMSVVAESPIVVPPLPTATGVEIMAETFKVKVGESVVLPLEVIGGSLAEGTTPQWSTEGNFVLVEGVVGGAKVTGLMPSDTVKVRVDAEGAGPLTDTIVGQVVRPLATAVKIHSPVS